MADMSRFQARLIAEMREGKRLFEILQPCKENTFELHENDPEIFYRRVSPSVVWPIYDSHFCVGEKIVLWLNTGVELLMKEEEQKSDDQSTNQ